MIVSIIGTGLIGGSAAMTLRRKGFADRFIGYDHNQENASKAVELGIIDESVPLEALLQESDLVILAIPVDAARELLPSLLDSLRDGGTIVDMGSTKAGIASSVQDHPGRSRFVAAHPIAGTEYSGPAAAFDGLYQDRKVIICDTQNSDADSIHLVERMFRTLGMDLEFMGALSHDLHAAYVSHLSHIISFTLALTVLDIEKDETQISNLAGSGFASTARLAKSSPAMWAPIFEQNADHLPEALDQFINYLNRFKNAIQNSDRTEMVDLMQKANKIREMVDDIEAKQRKS